MTRRLKLVLVVLVIAAVALGALVLALPEIARRVAVSQIAQLTGRAARIEAIELNPFTGRFAMKGFRLAERTGPDAFVTLDRVEGRLWIPAVLGHDIRLLELRVVAPAVRVVRTGAAEFNFSDVLARLAPSDPAAPPGPWTVTVDRAAISAGKILAEDRVVAPAADWSVEGIEVELSGASSGRGRAPGTVKMSAKLGATAVELTGGVLRLSPSQASGRLKLTGFDLRRVRPYAPPGTPVEIDAGTVSLALALEWKREDGKPDRARAEGEVVVEALAVSQPGAPAPFATLPRLVVQIKEVDPFARAITLGAVEVEGLDAEAVRRPDGSIDLVPAASAAAPPNPAPSTPTSAAPGSDASTPAPPSPAVATSPQVPTDAAAAAAGGWAVRLDRLAVKDSRAVMVDQTTTPAREWRIEALTVEGAALSLVRGDAPGSLQLKAQVRAAPGGAVPATIGVELDTFRVEPLLATGRLSLGGLDLNTLWPYVRAGLPAALSRGILALDLAAEIEEGDSAMARATVNGTVRLTDVAATQRGATSPFITVPSRGVRVRQIDALQYTGALSDVAVEGAHVRVVRDAQGQVDLEALAEGWAPPPEAARPPPGEAPAIPRRLIVTAIQKALAAPWSVSLDRFSLTKSTASFEDRLMSPPVSLGVDDVAVNGQSLTWPPKGPATIAASFGMPGGGRTELKLTGVPDPLDIQFAAATRDAPIEPYQPYFPFPARFRGKFSGDSLSEVKKDGDVYNAASRGTAWATEISIEDPESPTPPFRMDRMEIRDIDFSWPNYALVKKVTMSRPHVQVERSADGVFNLRRLFTPTDKPGDGGAPPASPAPAVTTAADPPDEPKKPPLIQTIVLDFSEIAIEEGAVRFLDRTTKPAFSEDMTHLNVTVRDLSNVLGRQRTTMTTQATVGDNAKLDLRGELSGIGETLKADLVGELRDFDLSTANPYADSVTAWVVERGKLQAKVHFRVEGDRISVENDVNFGGLKVAKGKGDDEAKKRLGLPLGLIVGLLKDTRGNIDFNLPLHGTLSDRNFDWGETIWAGVKQTVVKVLVGPFRAIGRLFTGGGDDKIEALRVEPVTFPAGSSVLAPAMEEHLVKVGDFLRRSPYVDLTLSAVATAADAESLRSQALTARIEKLRDEKKLADFPAAVTAYWEAQKIDGPPPKTTEERLAALRAREPAPDAAAVQGLLDRRLAATRDALTRLEGIPAERLVAGAPRPLLEDKGEGRVEFSFDPGEPPPGG